MELKKDCSTPNYEGIYNRNLNHYAYLYHCALSFACPFIFRFHHAEVMHLTQNSHCQLNTIVNNVQKQTYAANVPAEHGIALINVGASPLQNPPIPLSTKIFREQSNIPLYCLPPPISPNLCLNSPIVSGILLLNPTSLCIRDLMTSKG